MLVNHSKEKERLLKSEGQEVIGLMVFKGKFRDMEANRLLIGGYSEECGMFRSGS
jgi:hypothetical protein